MGFFKGHTTTIRANKIADFTVSTAEYGSAVPEILGTTRISGNVIYYDDFTAHEHRETQRSGKGGHSSKTVTISYTYTVAVILGLCEGPIQGLKRVWIGKDIYTYPNDTIQLTLFTGETNQKPWAYTLGKHPDKALSYSGLAYMAGVIDLGDSGSMPNYNFEVVGKLTNTGDGIDVNPADYMRYILDKVGLSDVEIVGLDNYRQYCKAADMLISTPPDETSAKSAREIINEIATLTNAYVFWSNDTFKIVPLDDRDYTGWKPNRTILYDLSADDFIPQSGGALVTYQRKDSSEVYNQYPVEFINRENGYEKESVSYAVTQDIADYGLRQANTTQAHYLYTKERAVKLAEQLARKGKYERNKYTFKLDWSFCRLEVGDLVTLTDENCGLNKQVVMIDSVTEGTDGLLTFTAVSRPEGTYTAAKYNVHETDRPYINYNKQAPNTDKPVILQPPADLTTNGLEVWIGARGTGDNWGGCDVYVSDDNAHYRHAGTITSSARIGTLAKAIDATADTIEVTANGTFLSGSEQDAKRGNTLCWLDGECFSYQTADLLPGGNYQLTGCMRGQYNTTAESHAAGCNFARLDSTLLKIPFRKEDVGKQVWLKFVSFNIFGSGYQSLADVQAYEYVLLPYYIPPVSNVRAYNRYRQMADGVSRYDIVVSWDEPNMQSYLEGQVWYKTNHQQAANIVIKEGVPADEIGFSGEWTFAGSGKNQVTIPQAVVGDTYRICVCTKDEWGVATSPDTAPSVDILVAMKSTVPNVPDGFSLAFGELPVASWNEVTNTDIVYYEIRLDNLPGVESDTLLARTNNLQTSLSLHDRSGTLYLFAKNALGKYSDAAVLTYTKPLPATPIAPVLTARLGQIGIEVGEVPAGCTGTKYYINDTTVFTSPNNAITYQCEPGIYNVCAVYTDYFGEGKKSLVSTITIKMTIDKEWIEKKSISIDKVDHTITDAINDAANSAGPALDEVKQQVTDLQTDAENLAKKDTELQNTLTGVQTNLDGLTSTVNDQAGQVSQLKQRADSIETTVTNNKKSQDTVNGGVQTQISQVSQKADGISSTVATITNNLNKAPSKSPYQSISQLQQTADTITSTISSNKAAQDEQNATFETEISQIKQTGGSITAVVAELNKNPKDCMYNSISKLYQTSNEITTTVQQNKTAQDKINDAQTATNSSVQTQISQVSQKADSIRSTVSANKIAQDETNQTLQSSITQNAESIASVVGNLSDSTKAAANYSAFTQLQDDINLRVKKGDVINQINVSDESILIDGKKVHITGDTVFDNNVIAKGMIQAGAVTADKLAAADITLGKDTATGVIAGAVKLDSDGMTVTGKNGSSILFGQNGMTFKDSLNNTFAALGRFCTGVASDGDTVKFASAWDVVPTVLLFPNQLQTSAVGYTNVNIWQHIEPLNITKEGFKVCCQSVLKAGSGGSFVVNTKIADWNLANNKSGQTYTYKLNVPTTATKAQINLSSVLYGYTKKKHWSDGDDSGWDYDDYDTVLYVKFAVDGTTYSDFVEIGRSSGDGSTNPNFSKQINLNNNSEIAIILMFKGFDYHPTLIPGGQGYYSEMKGTCTLQSYSLDTASDSVIARGTAGFIAIDPNSCPYTVTKG